MLKKLIVACALSLASLASALAAVNINTASQEELASLPNIGPAKAKAIVEYRKANGEFKTLEELKKIKGIGDKTFEKLKPQLSLSGETRTSAARPAKAGPAAGKKAESGASSGK